MKAISKKEFNRIFPTLEKHYNNSQQREKGWTKTVHHVYLQDDLAFLLKRIEENKK